jgi:L-tryptophan--pyruvate aminotransferase
MLYFEVFDIRVVVVNCSGDPVMFEEFWHGTVSAAEILIPGWQTMSYFSDVGNLCWFLEPSLNHQVRRLHRRVGNAYVDGYHVLVGNSSTQLFMAALYALSPPSPGAAPMSVVSTAPYYSVRPQQQHQHKQEGN